MPKKGFTLIEMVMYMGILVLLLAVVTSLLLWMLRAHSSTQARKLVADNVQATLTVMANEIREAQSIYTPAEYAVPPVSPWPQLSLETTKNLPAGETSTYVDFFLCGDRICLKRESQNPIALTSKDIEVQSLGFEHIQTGGVPSLQITIQAKYKNPANRPELIAEATIQTSVSLRAYE